MRNNLIITGVVAFSVGVGFGVAMSGGKQQPTPPPAESPPPPAKKSTASGGFEPIGLGTYREDIIRSIRNESLVPRLEESDAEGWHQTILRFDGVDAHIRCNGPSGFHYLTCVAFVGPLNDTSRLVLQAMVHAIYGEDRGMFDERVSAALTLATTGVDVSIDAGYRMTLGQRGGIHFVTIRPSDEQIDVMNHLGAAADYYAHGGDDPRP